MNATHSARLSMRVAAGFAGIVAFGTLVAFRVPTRYLGAVLITAPLLAIAVRYAVFSDYASATFLYAALLVLTQFFKRLVFVFPDQAPLSQYSVLLVAHVCLALLLARGLAEHRFRFDRLSKLFSAFLFLALASTWLNREVGFLAKAVGSAWILSPYFTFFVWRAAAESPDFLVRFGRFIVLLAVAAALMGTYQFVVGPTIVDEAWAESAHEFSIQARNVYRFMTGEVRMMRVFSFCSDHFGFAYLQVAGLVSLGVLTALRRAPKSHLQLGAGILVFGLAISLSRSAWAAGLAMLVVLTGLHLVPGIRGRALFIVLISGYVFASLLAVLLFRFWWAGGGVDAESDIAVRAFKLGTLSDRSTPWESFVGTVRTYPLLGAGAGANRYVLGKITGSLAAMPVSEDTTQQHNFLIKLTLLSGVPGLVAFLLWLRQLMRLAGRHIAQSGRGGKRALQWTLAVVMALFVAGSIGSHVFFAGFFWAWCGVLARPQAQGEILEVKCGSYARKSGNGVVCSGE